jgi:hypothetical protein
VIDQKTAVQDTLRMLPKADKLISDLKMCIICNRTNIPFFTSDDLAVQANRFRIQRQRFSHGGVGLMNAGLMFFLPLTPTYYFAAYDSDVYTCPDRTNSFFEIRPETDAVSPSIPQVVKARPC